MSGKRSLYRGGLALVPAAAVFMLAGCASGGAQVEATPAPVAPAAAEAQGNPLDPPAAAVRASAGVQLTGTELGTMWTFENPPLAYWQKQYGFQATPQWLEHVRLSSVRYGEICSASFVSPTGLVMTNHHCARDCVEAVSTAEKDYVLEGFYAPTRQGELTCPDLFLDQLHSIEDVTARVQAAGSGGTDAQVAAAQEAEEEKIEQECATATKMECQVVSLFHGGQYKVYRYQRYKPVKLVFAPELDAAFFGGDPDNFTYPRYDLDVSFVRAYEADGTTPAATPHFFQWDADGAKEGELVFVTGNPGSTSRSITMAQVMYKRRYSHPFNIQYLEAQRTFLKRIAAQSPERERQVRNDLFSIENSIKALSGEFAGLMDTLLLAKKVRWEREFRDKVNAGANLHSQYGDVWDRLAEINARKLQIAPLVNLTNLEFLAPPHLEMAGLLVRYIQQIALPEAQRAEMFRGDQLRQLEGMLGAQVPIDPEMGGELLRLRLDIARSWVPDDDLFRRDLFSAGETPEQATQRLLRESRITDPGFRQALIRGGVAALDTASDPFVRMARTMAGRYTELKARLDSLNAAEKVQNERMAKALFAVYGTQLPPDATFTLRITDGVVRRYPYNGTLAPAFTYLYGLYERSAAFGNEAPFKLSKTFATRRGSVNLETPLNFVATTDITGGNSGSPIIDKEGRAVGLAFDGNIEGLPNEFLFQDLTGRTVGVHTGGITEALRNVYQAKALLDELLGAGRRQ